MTSKASGTASRRRSPTWQLEESLKFVVKPGLRAAGADMSRIVFPKVTFNGNEAPLIAAEDGELLTAELKAAGVRVIIVDPIMATIGHKVDIYRNNELRAALAPWTRIAEAVGGIVGGIVHLKKGNNSDVVGAVNGSSAFGEVARCVFGFVKDPDAEDGSRVMSQVKNSCGPEDLSRTYQIVSQEVTTATGRKAKMPLFIMGSDSDVSVEDILGSGGENGRGRRGATLSETSQAVLSTSTATNTRCLACSRGLWSRLASRGTRSSPGNTSSA